MSISTLLGYDVTKRKQYKEYLFITNPNFMQEFLQLISYQTNTITTSWCYCPKRTWFSISMRIYKLHILVNPFQTTTIVAFKLLRGTILHIMSAQANGVWLEVRVLNVQLVHYELLIHPSTIWDNIWFSFRIKLTSRY